MKTRIALFFLGFILAALFNAPMESKLSDVPPVVATPEIEVDICALEDVVCEGENVTSTVKTVVKTIGKIRTITAYNSVPEQTDGDPCIAASNVNICEYTEATANDVCASNDYPFWTVLYFKDHGECVVLDRMNSRYTGKGHVDWYFKMDVKAARQHGTKQDELRLIVYPKGR